MTDMIQTLRAIIRDELARVRPPQLATVTEVFPKGSDSAADNHQINVALRPSGVELQRVPVVAGRLGLAALPRVGDLQLIAFVDGDLNAPIAIGSVYDDQAHPPTGEADEVVYQPPGDEDGGLRRIHVELPGGSLLTLKDDEFSIELGGTTVTVAKDGDVTVKAAGKVSIEADGDLSLTASGDLSATAQGKLALKGSTATLESSAQTEVKGAMISLAGQTQFSPS